MESTIAQLVECRARGVEVVGLESYTDGVVLCPCDMVLYQSLLSRVKVGKFGHQVNSDTRLQTVEIQMRLFA